LEHLVQITRIRIPSLAAFTAARLFSASMEIEPLNDGQTAMTVVIGLFFWALFFYFNFGL